MPDITFSVGQHATKLCFPCRWAGSITLMMMRWLQILACVGPLSLGCGDDDSPSRAGADAGSDASAGIDPEVEKIVTGWVEAWDRLTLEHCECYAEMGVYASVEECTKLTGSGPDWVSCAAKLGTEQDSPQIREIVACSVEQSNMRTECLSELECGSDAWLMCDGIRLDCAMLDAESTVLISTRCPDTTFLPRQSP